MPHREGKGAGKTKRPIGEVMNNPLAEVSMRERNMMEEARKDGAHGIEMFMPPKMKGGKRGR